MRSREAEAALAMHAADQWGYFTTAQARRLGLTRKRLSQLTAAGRISHTDAHGVHQFAGAPTNAATAALRTHWLALHADQFATERIQALREGHPDAVVSHRSAAVIHGITTPSEVLHYTVMSRRRTTISHVRFHLDPTVDWQCLDALPVTPVPTTIADLHHAGTDLTELGHIITAALQRVLTDVGELAHALDPATGGRGQQTVMRSLAAAGTPDTLAEGNRLLFSTHR